MKTPEQIKWELVVARKQLEEAKQREFEATVDKEAKKLSSMTAREFLKEVCNNTLLYLPQAQEVLYRKMEAEIRLKVETELKIKKLLEEDV